MIAISEDKFKKQLPHVKLLLNNFTQLNIQNKRINPKNKVDLN
jgi:hypothetical protein